MYLNTAFAERRVEVLHEHIRSHPLGALVTIVDGRIAIDHMPFLLSSEGGKRGTLYGHIPRANSVWRALDGTSEAVIVFQGPESYISPSWYASKREHGRVVPTWNYTVVHAHGNPRAIDDPGWILAHLNELTEMHEAARPNAWSVADAPPEYVAAMVRRLVGVEMPIEDLVGKWKLGQNRPEADRRGVAEGLRARGDAAASAMERLVSNALEEATARRDT